MFNNPEQQVLKAALALYQARLKEGELSNRPEDVISCEVQLQVLADIQAKLKEVHKC